MAPGSRSCCRPPPLLDDAGKARGGLAAIVDISELRRVESHRQVLLYELQHRVKNIITTIGALANRTMRGSATLEEFSEAFLGRLHAMASTHEFLSRGNWTGSSLRALIQAAVQSHPGRDISAVSLRGPDLVLTARAAATLGLAFYELTTNAGKHGSLSAPGGRVDVIWRTGGEEDQRLVLDWIERDGARIEGPLRAGFGTSFVKRSIEYELGGTADLQLLPEGMRCILAFPLKRNVQAWAEACDNK